MTFGELKELVAELDTLVSDNVPVMVTTGPSWQSVRPARQLGLVGDALVMGPSGVSYGLLGASRDAWNDYYDNR